MPQIYLVFENSWQEGSSTKNLGEEMSLIVLVSVLFVGVVLSEESEESCGHNVASSSGEFS